MKQLDRIEFYLRSLLEVSMFSSQCEFPGIDKKLTELDETMKLEKDTIFKEEWEKHIQSTILQCEKFVGDAIKKYTISEVVRFWGHPGPVVQYSSRYRYADLFAYELNKIELSGTVHRGLDLYKWLDEIAVSKFGPLRDKFNTEVTKPLTFEEFVNTLK